jgi:Flp pilus assembly protein TadD
LNNLAYRIAVDQHAPEEALPIARRAASLAPKDPRVLDTLGWINHLLGRSVEAVRLLTEALRTAPAAADIRLHAAFALAATASFKAAESHLNEAIRLAPDLASRPDVQALRETLAKRR